jgi:ComF family protein
LYDGLLRQAILRLKHYTGESMAYRLGELFGNLHSEELMRHTPRAVLPIPLHWRRKMWRGYNQSATIANGLARVLGIPMLNNVLRRIRATPSQQGLSPTARRGNMQGAFLARTNSTVVNQTVVLVDDVLTTGTTASAAAKALQKAGAAQVLVAVLAHR